MSDDLTPVPLHVEDLEAAPAAAGRRGRGGSRDLAALLSEVMVQRGRRLLKIAARWAGPDEAWDCVHAAAASALERPELFVHDDPRQLGVWLETATRHEALHVLRRRRGTEPKAPEQFDDLADPDLDPEGDAVRTDRRLVALEALADLKPVERACIIAVASGHRRAEVASRFGLSERVVARRLLEGRKALGHFAERYVSEERCRELRPDLSDLSDDALEGPPLETLRLHLRHCSGCRGQLVALRRERTAIGAALPPVLVLPGAIDDQAVVLTEGAEGVGDDLPERSGPLFAAFLFRVGAGWEVIWSGLTPLGRVTGLAAASVGLLFGVGTLWGEERPSQAPRDSIEAVAERPGEGDDARVSREPRPRPAPEPTRLSVGRENRPTPARSNPSPPPRDSKPATPEPERAAPPAAPAPEPEPEATYAPAVQPAYQVAAPPPSSPPSEPSPRAAAGFAGEFLP